MSESIYKILKSCAILVALILVFSLWIRPYFYFDESAVPEFGTGEISTSGSNDRMNMSLTDSKKYEDLENLSEKGFTKALGNSVLELFYKQETGEIALNDIIKNKVWYSNPQDREKETMLEGNARDRLSSQFSLSYYTSRSEYGSMDSYNDCVKHNNLDMKVENNKLIATYKVGRIVVTIDDVPQQISAKRFKKFYDKMDKDDKREIDKRYRVASIKDLTDKSVIDKLVRQYPNIKNDDIHYLVSTSERHLIKIKEIWDNAGYVSKDLEFDNEENTVKSEVVEKANFIIVLEYGLEKDSLIVKVDTEKIKMPTSIPIHTISLLEYFGSAGKEQDGYFLVADGSGALINFNSTKPYASAFKMNVYGDDYAIKDNKESENKCTYMLPVYGINQGDNAIFAEITDGSEFSSINSQVSGMLHSYNTISTEFTITSTDKVKINYSQATDPVNLNAEKSYSGIFAMSYTVMATNESTYSDMANLYQKRLVDRGQLKTTKTQTNPISISTIGGIEDKKTFGLINANYTNVQNDYFEVLELIEKLKHLGLTDIDLDYMNWQNKTSQNIFVKSLATSKALGGQKAFNKMIETLEKEDTQVFLELDFLKIGRTGYGYNNRNYNIRHLSKDICDQFFLKPTLIEQSVNYIDKNAKKIGIKNIKLTDVGNTLYSDFDTKSFTLRNKSVENIKKTLSQLSQKYNLSIDTPNLYALPYASKATEVPMKSSGFEIEDMEVPFYQMVLSGYIPYQSQPVNYETNINAAFLNALEYGSKASVFISGKNTSTMKETDYNKYYTGYINDITQHIPMIKEYSKAISKVEGKKILTHNTLAVGCFKTTFEDGTNVYVNYTDTDMKFDGITVKSNKYYIT